MFFYIFAAHIYGMFSGCSAVGSVLRSGRRGRAFESPYPDKMSPGKQLKPLLWRTPNGGLAFFSRKKFVPDNKTWFLVIALN